MSNRTVARAHLGGSVERSFLLRIQLQFDGTRYLVQDLKTGERWEFDSEAALRQFIVERAAGGLR